VDKGVREKKASQEGTALLFLFRKRGGELNRIGVGRSRTRISQGTSVVRGVSLGGCAEASRKINDVPPWREQARFVRPKNIIVAGCEDRESCGGGRYELHGAVQTVRGRERLLSVEELL